MDINREGKYQKVAQEIENQIKNGILKPGDKLPSENELTVKYELSRQTIRNALSVLERENLIYSVRGSGTYVSAPRTNPMAGRKTIALIMTYVDGYIFPRIISKIQNTLFEEGYSVQINFTNNRIDRERVILEEIIERDEVAGIIAEATKSGIPNPDMALYSEIIKKQIPVLFINSYYSNVSVPHVSMDDITAGKKATEYLISNGHRRIAGMFKLDDIQGRLRFSGYMDAMMKCNMEWHDENIIWYDTEDLKNLGMMQDKIRDRLKGCTGFVVYNDELAYNLMPLLKELGYDIPANLSIVSIDNSELAVLGDTKLTSVPFPLDTLGTKAAQNMLRMINEPGFDGNYEFDEPLAIRESVTRLKC